MMKTIRKIGLLSALIALMVVGVSVNASADTVLQIGDAWYVGSIEGANPANATAESGFINTLIGLAPGPASLTDGTQQYELFSTAASFPTTTPADSDKQDNGNTSNSFASYQYILGKYGQTAHVWFSETGWDTSMNVVLPGTASDRDGTSGLSHTSAYNAVSVPEPGSLSLLLLGLTGVGGLALRRKQ